MKKFLGITLFLLVIFIGLNFKSKDTLDYSSSNATSQVILDTGYIKNSLYQSDATAEKLRQATGVDLKQEVESGIESFYYEITNNLRSLWR